MLIHFLSIVGVLGIVILGMLVMTQLVSLEELGRAIWRAFITVLLVLIAFCVAKTVLLPILVSWLVGLKQMLLWIAIVVLALVIALLVLRIVISKLAQRPLARDGHDEGEL
jgi:hypothetical protein